MVAALPLGAGFPVQPAQAQDPPLPPPEVFNCARAPADRILDGLEAPESFKVTLDAENATAILSIPELPDSATCYVVAKSPSGTGPLFLEWDAAGIAAPGDLVDPEGFASAGEYCYRLIVGNPEGRSEAVERCLDVPTSVVPAPTATPTLSATPPIPVLPGATYTETPKAPDTGSAMSEPPTGNGAVALGLAALLLAGGAAFVMSRFARGAR